MSCNTASTYSQSWKWLGTQIRTALFVHRIIRWVNFILLLTFETRMLSGCNLHWMLWTDSNIYILVVCAIGPIALSNKIYDRQNIHHSVHRAQRVRVEKKRSRANIEIIHTKMHELRRSIKKHTHTHICHSHPNSFDVHSVEYYENHIWLWNNSDFESHSNITQFYRVFIEVEEGEKKCFTSATNIKFTCLQ